jgi:HEAT repeat protein
LLSTLLMIQFAWPVQQGAIANQEADRTGRPEIEQSGGGPSAGAVDGSSTISDAVAPFLTDALRSENQYIQILGAWTFRLVGQPSASTDRALLEVLRDEDSNATWALKEIGEAAVPTLIMALGDGSANVRRDAATVLGWMAWEAGDASSSLANALAAAIPSLSEALDDEEWFVRDSAEWALWEIKEKPGITRHHSTLEVAELIEVLREESWHVRHNAALALKALGPNSVPLLSEAMKDRDKKVRRHAVWVLGEFGDDARAAILVLSDAMRDDGDGLVRGRAAIALGKIGKAAVPALSTFLTSEDTNTKLDAIEALAEIGRDAEAAIPALTRALDDNNRRVQSAAADALEEMTPAGSVE